VEALLSWAYFKQSKYLKKTDGTKTQRIRGIVKLEDANDAGGRNSEKCTLILTEGDSAKALAVSGCTLSTIVYIQILIEKFIFQILV
jgi:DNA topoisomerase-2